MSFEVMLAVLLSSLLHAGWNALLRSAGDRTQDLVLIVCSAALLAACTLPFMPLPAAASWPYLAASAAANAIYYFFLTNTYRHGTLSFAYPVMRGSAPALTLIAAAVLFAEIPSITGWAGVALVSGGILLLAGDAQRQGSLRRHTLSYALATALMITVYTLIDGAGVRASGHAVAYAMWLFTLIALPVAAYACLNDRKAFMHYGLRHWRRGLAGGCCTLLSYTIVLWAMTRAPIALVAALREVSVIFAVLIAVFAMHERVTRLRIIAIAVVVAGATAVKLA